MTSFVYDFKDIASRMKGELKAQPTLEEILGPEEHTCLACNGSGQDKTKYWNSPCSYCNGFGVVS